MDAGRGYSVEGDEADENGHQGDDVESRELRGGREEEQRQFQ